MLIKFLFDDIFEDIRYWLKNKRSEYFVVLDDGEKCQIIYTKCTKITTKVFFLQLIPINKQIGEHRNQCKNEEKYDFDKYFAEVQLPDKKNDEFAKP